MKETEAGPSLTGIQITSWALLAIMGGISWLIFGPFFAGSVLVGGVIANTSFLLLQRDLTGLLQGVLDGVKARFFIKYYLRLAILAIVLFILISKGLIHLIGLLVGLSTILVSISILAVGIARKTINIREAS